VSIVGALLADACAVLLFVGIGLDAHGHAVTLTGMASTSWPFLAGECICWVAVRAWRHPQFVIPSGVAIWMGCVAFGMALRVLSGQGTAGAFIGVALGFLGAEILGWRLLAAAVRRRRARGRGGSR